MKKESIKNLFASVFFVLISIVFFIIMFFTSIQILANSNFFFNRYYTSVNIKAETDIEVGEAVYIINTLVDYMEGKTKQLSLRQSILEFNDFSEREIQHMEDVKDIYISFKFVRNLVFVLYFGLLVLLLKKRIVTKLFKKTLLSFIFAILIFTILIGFVMYDFSSFWNIFHHILFNNDLWLLDYASSIIIRVCTLDMFKTFILYSTMIYLFFSILWLVLVNIFQKNDYC